MFGDTAVFIGEVYDVERTRKKQREVGQLDEASLRLEYWVETRSHPQFPLWVIFKEIGHSPTQCDQLPYGRRSRRTVPELFKELEQQASLATIAKDIGVPEQEMRAAIWYAIWVMEHQEPQDIWQAWNDRIDAAWRHGLLHD